MKRIIGVITGAEEYLLENTERTCYVDRLGRGMGGFDTWKERNTTTEVSGCLKGQSIPPSLEISKRRNREVSYLST